MADGTFSTNYVVALTIDRLSEIERLHKALQGIVGLNGQQVGLNVKVTDSSWDDLAKNVADAVTKGVSGRTPAGGGTPETVVPPALPAGLATKLEHIAGLAEPLNKIADGLGRAPQRTDDKDHGSSGSKSAADELERAVAQFKEAVAAFCAHKGGGGGGPAGGTVVEYDEEKVVTQPTRKRTVLKENPARSDALKQTDELLNEVAILQGAYHGLTAKNATTEQRVASAVFGIQALSKHAVSQQKPDPELGKLIATIEDYATSAAEPMAQVTDADDHDFLAVEKALDGLGGRVREFVKAQMARLKEVQASVKTMAETIAEEIEEPDPTKEPVTTTRRVPRPSAPNVGNGPTIGAVPGEFKLDMAPIEAAFQRIAQNFATTIATAFERIPKGTIDAATDALHKSAGTMPLSSAASPVQSAVDAAIAAAPAELRQDPNMTEPELALRALQLQKDRKQRADAKAARDARRQDNMQKSRQRVAQARREREQEAYEKLSDPEKELLKRGMSEGLVYLPADKIPLSQGDITQDLERRLESVRKDTVQPPAPGENTVMGQRPPRADSGRAKANPEVLKLTKQARELEATIAKLESAHATLDPNSGASNEAVAATGRLALHHLPVDDERRESIREKLERLHAGTLSEGGTRILRNSLRDQLLPVINRRAGELGVTRMNLDAARFNAADPIGFTPDEWEKGIAHVPPELRDIVTHKRGEDPKQARMIIEKYAPRDPNAKAAEGAHDELMRAFLGIGAEPPAQDDGRKLSVMEGEKITRGLMRSRRNMEQIPEGYRALSPGQVASMSAGSRKLRALLNAAKAELKERKAISDELAAKFTELRAKNPLLERDLSEPLTPEGVQTMHGRMESILQTTEQVQSLKRIANGGKRQGKPPRASYLTAYTEQQLADEYEKKDDPEQAAIHRKRSEGMYRSIESAEKRGNTFYEYSGQEYIEGLKARLTAVTSKLKNPEHEAQHPELAKEQSELAAKIAKGSDMDRMRARLGDVLDQVERPEYKHVKSKLLIEKDQLAQALSMGGEWFVGKGKVSQFRLPFLSGKQPGDTDAMGSPIDRPLPGYVQPSDVTPGEPKSLHIRETHGLPFLQPTHEEDPIAAVRDKMDALQESRRKFDAQEPQLRERHRELAETVRQRLGEHVLNPEKGEQFRALMSTHFDLSDENVRRNESLPVVEKAVTDARTAFETQLKAMPEPVASDAPADVIERHKIRTEHVEHHNAKIEQTLTNAEAALAAFKARGEAIVAEFARVEQELGELTPGRTAEQRKSGLRALNDYARSSERVAALPDERNGLRKQEDALTAEMDKAREKAEQRRALDLAATAAGATGSSTAAPAGVVLGGAPTATATAEVAEHAKAVREDTAETKALHEGLSALDGLSIAPLIEQFKLLAQYGREAAVTLTSLNTKAGPKQVGRLLADRQRIEGFRDNARERATARTEYGEQRHQQVLAEITARAKARTDASLLTQGQRIDGYRDNARERSDANIEYSERRHQQQLAAIAARAKAQADGKVLDPETESRNRSLSASVGGLLGASYGGVHRERLQQMRDDFRQTLGQIESRQQSLRTLNNQIDQATVNRLPTGALIKRSGKTASDLGADYATLVDQAEVAVGVAPYRFRKIKPQIADYRKLQGQNMEEAKLRDAFYDAEQTMGAHMNERLTPDERVRFERNRDMWKTYLRAKDIPDADRASARAKLAGAQQELAKGSTTTAERNDSERRRNDLKDEIQVRGYTDVEHMNKALADRVVHEHAVGQAIGGRVQKEEQAISAQLKAVNVMDRFAGKLKSLAIYAGAGFLLYSAFQKAREAFGNAEDIEKGLVDIAAQQRGTSLNDLMKIEDGTISAAQRYGAQLKEILELTKTFSKEGLGPEKALERAQEALTGQRAYDLSPESTASFLQSTDALFSGRMTGEEALDKVGAVSGRNRVGPEALLQAVEKSGAAYTLLQQKQTGSVGALDALLGSATAIIEKTRVSGSSAGASLNTILGRVSSPETGKKLQESYGIKLGGETSHELRPITDILGDIAKQYTSLMATGQSVKATSLLETVAGPRNIGAAAALFSNWEKAMKAAADSSQSLGESSRRLALQMDTLKAKHEQMKAAWDSFTLKFIESTGIMSLTKKLTDFATQKLLSGAKGMENGPAAAFGMTAAGSLGALIGLKGLQLGATKMADVAGGGIGAAIGQIGRLLGWLANPELLLGATVVAGLIAAIAYYHNKGKGPTAPSFDKLDPNAIEQNERVKAYNEQATSYGMSGTRLQAVVADALGKAEGDVASSDWFKKAGLSKERVFTSDESIRQTDPRVFAATQNAYVKHLEEALPALKALKDMKEKAEIASKLLDDTAAQSRVVVDTRMSQLQQKRATANTEILTGIQGMIGKHVPNEYALHNLAVNARIGQSGGSETEPATYGFSYNRDLIAALHPTAKGAGLDQAVQGDLRSILTTAMQGMGGLVADVRLSDNSTLLSKLASSLERADSGVSTFGQALDKAADTLFTFHDEKTKAIYDETQGNLAAMQAKGVSAADIGIAANRDQLSIAIVNGIKQSYVSDAMIEQVGKEQALRNDDGTEGGSHFKALIGELLDKNWDRIVASVEKVAPKAAKDLKAGGDTLKQSGNRPSTFADLISPEKFPTLSLARDRLFSPLINYGVRMSEIQGQSSSFGKAGISFDRSRAEAQASQTALEQISGVVAQARGDVLRAAEKSMETREIAVQIERSVQSPLAGDDTSPSGLAGMSTEQRAQMGKVLGAATTANQIKKAEMGETAAREVLELLQGKEGGKKLLAGASKDMQEMFGTILNGKIDFSKPENYLKFQLETLPKIKELLTQIAAIDEARVVANERMLYLGQHSSDVDLRRFTAQVDHTRLQREFDVRMQEIDDPQSPEGPAMRLGMMDDEHAATVRRAGMQRDAALHQINVHATQDSGYANGVQITLDREKIVDQFNDAIEQAGEQLQDKKFQFVTDLKVKLASETSQDMDNMIKQSTHGLSEGLSKLMFDPKHEHGVQFAQDSLGGLAKTLNDRVLSNVMQSFVGEGGIFRNRLESVYKNTDALQQRNLIIEAHKIGIVEGFAQVYGKGGAVAGAGGAGGVASAGGSVSSDMLGGAVTLGAAAIGGVSAVSRKIGALTLPQSAKSATVAALAEKFGSRGPTATDGAGAVLGDMATLAKMGIQLTPSTAGAAATAAAGTVTLDGITMPAPKVATLPAAPFDKYAQLKSAGAMMAGTMGGSVIGAKLGVNKGENFGSEGASTGAMLGMMAGGPVGAVVGGLLGGFIGGRFGTGHKTPEYGALEKIDRNTRETITAIDNQTRDLLNLDTRMLNVPASFVVPGYRPMGVGGGAGGAAGRSLTQHNTFMVTVHEATDARAVADAVHQKIQQDLRISGTYIDPREIT